MTIRLKVRILLLVSVSLTVFYIVSHVYRLNNWFTEKNIVVKEEEQGTLSKQYETTFHPTSNNIQFNATTNTVKSSSIHTEIKTLKPSYNDIPTEYKPDNRNRPVKNSSGKLPIIQEKDQDEYPKHVEDTPTDVQDTAGISSIERETANEFPTQKLGILHGVTQIPTNISDDELDAEPSVTPIVNDNLTEDQQDQGDGSGDVGDGKVTTNNKSFDTVNVAEGDGIVKEIKNDNPPLTSEILTTAIIPPSASSSKIYFEGTEMLTNKTDKDGSDYDIEKPLPALPTVTADAFSVHQCTEKEGIKERIPKIKSKCNLYSNQVDTCSESAKYYSEKTLANPIKCSERKHPPICYFVNSTRTDHHSKLNLKCNYSMCHRNEVRVGILNATSGKITYMFLNSLRTVVKTLEQETGYDAKDHGADFIFLSCKLNRKKKHVHQILPFPPLVLKAKSRKRNLIETKKAAEKFNINIVVLDSLSRKHFYRTLTKTTNAMKAINMDKSNQNLVLDFKGFQSLAPFTYVNLQALLTGSVAFDNINTRRYNFEDLFSLFQASEYQTLLQEDTCWHDEWGSILTGNRKLEKQDPHYRKKIWDEIRNLTMHHGIDSFGLTHMSCDVLAKFDVTNLYNSNTMVCLNGEPLSAYFLEHVLDNILTRSMTTNAMPLLSYTHINIAHESSGVRVRGLDEQLQHFISVLGMTSNTLTIFLSDHGGKTSEYFMDTLAGRFEVYDPFLFMMVPKKLGDIVGEKNIQNLIDNQNSLLDVIDIRSMLLTINTILKDKSAPDKHHLLTESIKHRSDCEHISIRNYALCKCLNNVTFPNKEDDRYKEFMVWLGEFAVGFLNNKLASQQLTSKSGHRCLRVHANNDGDSIRNIIERRSSKGVVYLFDIVTKHDDTIDAYSFQILYNEFKRNEKYELLQVEHWTRVSIYSRYASCKDKNVSYEICMCSDDRREKIDTDYISKYKQFQTPTDSIALLNRTCARLLKRTNLYVVTFEIANMCEKKINVEFSTKVKYSWVASQSLPLEVTVKPYTIQFLVTFIKVVDYTEDIKPNIIIKN